MTKLSPYVFTIHHSLKLSLLCAHMSTRLIDHSHVVKNILERVVF